MNTLIMNIQCLLLDCRKFIEAMLPSLLVGIVIFLGVLSIIAVVLFCIYICWYKKYGWWNFVKWITQKNNIVLFFSIASLFAILGYEKFRSDLIDSSELITLILVTIFGILFIYIQKIIVKKTEDICKLTVNYNSLVKKYPREENWISYYNLNNEKRNLPVVFDFEMYNKKIKIYDSKEMYELPQEIINYDTEILKAHNFSEIYNQLNVRIKQWYSSEDEVVIYTERTTYYKSLVTNRAVDYCIRDSISVREILQFGPFLPSLEESKLSNHIGFNGFVVTQNNNIGFIKRGKKVSVSKNKYGTQISASLKTKYGLDEDMNFTVECLEKAILNEIIDECCVKKEDIVDFSVFRNIIAAYRDVVEGNKPQFLVYCKVNKNSEEIGENLNKSNKNLKNADSKEQVMLLDGKKIVWISLKNIDDIEIREDMLFYNNSKYPMVPSTIASFILFRNFYHEHKEIF